jgi:branched-chain amino acid transport system permease protein
VPSGYVLLMAYIGGVAFFIGPIIGAVLMTALQISLSDYTGAWQLYVGVMFVAVVMYAPWGLGGLLLMHAPLLSAGTWRRVLPAYAKVAVPAAMLFVGGVLLVETSHHLLVKASEGPAMRVLWLQYSANSPAVWGLTLVLLVAGGLLLKRLAPGVSEAFHGASQEAQRRRAAA